MERVKLKLEEPTAAVKLVRKRQVAELLGCSTWTIDQWTRRGKFPAPIFISDGAPARWRLGEIKRWLEGRERRRRRVIPRGRLRRGAAHE